MGLVALQFLLIQVEPRRELQQGALSGHLTLEQAVAEGGTCAFSGKKTVAYGAQGSFLYKTFTGGTPCTGAAFGGTDPLYGVAKSCYVP